MRASFLLLVGSFCLPWGCSSLTRPTEAALVDAQGCVIEPVGHAREAMLESMGATPQNRRYLESFETGEMQHELVFGARRHGSVPAPRPTDLDGDGGVDTFVMFPESCGANDDCPVLLYGTAQGCMRYMGAVQGAHIVVSEDDVGQVKRVSGYAPGMRCEGREGALRIFEFDGASYRATEQRTCSCPELDEEAERHALCPP